jgi:hypothetical protein
MPGGGEHLHRPQGHALIAGAAREAECSFNQLAANTVATSSRVDDHQPKFRHAWRMAHDKRRANGHPVNLGDYGEVPPRREASQQLHNDVSDIEFEAAIQPVLGGIERAMALDHPAGITRLEITKSQLSQRPAPQTSGRSALHTHRHTHATADAQRGEALLGVTAAHLVQQRHQDARA